MSSYDECNSSESEDYSPTWKSVHSFLFEYPEPFRGEENENVFDFIKNLERAFEYNRIAASCRVNILKRLTQGNADTTVSESKTLEENFEYLKWVFGNPRAIWKKEKDDFLKMLQKEPKNWSNQFSPERKRLLVKVSNFLRIAESLDKKFDCIKDDAFSVSTVNFMIQILPQNIFRKMIENICNATDSNVYGFLKLLRLHITMFSLKIKKDSADKILVPVLKTLL